ncbi:hypothetical protein [Micromonospora orduensis]|uniref:hypothetical protein n=1 Tax=Micromonospora orduensis TaxID=1420891 RepID=UPI0034069685
MTTNDIDAIRQQVPLLWARWQEIQNTAQPGLVTDRLICAEQSAADIPTVLRWVDGLTKEVEQLRADLDSTQQVATHRQTVIDDLTAKLSDAEGRVTALNRLLTQSRDNAATRDNEIGRLVAENARVRQQRDEALAEVDRLRGEWDRLVNERAAMLGVVRAAKEWRDSDDIQLVGVDEIGEELVAAVDALANAEAEAARLARIKSQAMRDHLFVGDGPHCEGWLGPNTVGTPEVGVISMRVGCGYPRDLHPDSVAPNTAEAVAR